MIQIQKNLYAKINIFQKNMKILWKNYKILILKLVYVKVIKNN